MADNVPADLTYDDIRLMYHTGKFIRDYGSQDKKAGKYRIGVMTKIGDIEERDWIRYAEVLIRRNNDEALFKQLKAWYRDTTSWLRNEKELHKYTLQCFVARIFDDPDWVDYTAFNQKYQPNLLTKTS
ncbi:MAG: hypothetical protein IJO56_08005 [Oscillospiraceae bacterium]|nr:hypothetical protein [Oscillospiraceae bacterium]